MLIDAYGMRVKHKIIKHGCTYLNKLLQKNICTLRVNVIFISKIGVKTADC